MSWIIQSLFGLRWAIPMANAWLAGGIECQPVWLHDENEGVAVFADDETRGKPVSDEDYYSVPAVICDGYKLQCTWEGCR